MYGEKPDLSNVEKIELCTYGLNPKEFWNHYGGHLNGTEVLSALKQNYSIIFLDGIHFEEKSKSHNIKFSLEKPFIFTTRFSEKPKERLAIFPFGYQSGLIDRFEYDFNDVEAIDSESNFVRHSIKIRTGENATVEIMPNQEKRGRWIPKKIVKSEIHKRLFEQIAENHEIDIAETTFKRNEYSSWVMESARYQISDDKSVTISTPRHHKDIISPPRIELQIEDVSSELAKEIEKSIYFTWGADNFFKNDKDNTVRIGLAPTFLQARNLESIMNQITRN